MKRSEKITKLEYRINILNELLAGDSISEQTRKVYEEELDHKLGEFVDLKAKLPKDKTGNEKQITLHDISLENYAVFKKIIAIQKIKHDRNVTQAEMFVEFMNAWREKNDPAYNENGGKLF